MVVSRILLQVFLTGRSRHCRRLKSRAAKVDSTPAAILGIMLYKSIELLQTELLLDLRNASFRNRAR